MERAVHPILDEVREEHDFHYLEDDGLGNNPGAEGVPGSVMEDEEGRRHRDESDGLHEKAGDEIVEEVFSRLFAEEMLFGAVGEKAFEGDKEQAGQGDVKNEPVEAKKGRRTARRYWRRH